MPAINVPPMPPNGGESVQWGDEEVMVPVGTNRANHVMSFPASTFSAGAANESAVAALMLNVVEKDPYRLYVAVINNNGPDWVPESVDGRPVDGSPVDGEWGVRSLRVYKRVIPNHADDAGADDAARTTSWKSLVFFRAKRTPTVPPANQLEWVSANGQMIEPPGDRITVYSALDTAPHVHLVAA